VHRDDAQPATAVAQEVRDDTTHGVKLTRASAPCGRAAADHSARRRTNHARIDALLGEIECRDFDLGAAAAYGRVRARVHA
jgi:hypothetical protein